METLSYVQLMERCIALAAENASINFYLRNGPVILKGGELAAAHQFAPETPSTDAFLAEVRAQGGAKALEDFAEFNIKSIDPLDDEYTEVLKETARAARGFAAKIRQEAAQ